MSNKTKKSTFVASSKSSLPKQNTAVDSIAASQEKLIKLTDKINHIINNQTTSKFQSPEPNTTNQNKKLKNPILQARQIRKYYDKRYHNDGQWLETMTVEQYLQEQKIIKSKTANQKLTKHKYTNPLTNIENKINYNRLKKKKYFNFK